ncbi:MAG: hypothetical protein DWQ41_05365 [Planctomycetota bacterium]|nr:MAG: hypothetical protein DWQ41_05365 [Planctomycetota bacterium]
MLAALGICGGSAQAGLFDFLESKLAGPPRVYETAAQVEPPSGPAIVPPPAVEAESEQPPLPAVPDEPVPSAPMLAPAPAIELYPNVSYDDRDEMHPYAEPVIVAVPDPSSVKHPFYWLVGDAPCNNDCVQPMAYVEICIPPNCPVPQPSVRHNGRKYVYDFGKYSVEVKLERGGIEVEYDD